MADGRNVLVTGATGFLGRHLCRRLMSEGWTVHALVHRRIERLPEGCIGHSASGGVDQLGQVMLSARPEAVVHLATRFVAEHGAQDVDPVVEANVAFGARLLEAMKSSGIRRIVCADSAWQYSGSASNPAATFYAASKSAFNVFLGYFADAERFSALSLVVPDTYGPDDGRGKLVERLLACAGGAEPLKLSPGEQRIDLLHVDDVVNGFSVALHGIVRNSEPPGRRIFGLTSDSPVRVRELVALVEQVTGKAHIATLGALPYRQREIMEPWRPREVLPDWSPHVRLDQGLSTLWRATRSNDP